MNDSGPDLVVLLLGVVLTFGIGTLLLQAGRPYLEQVFPEPHVAKGVDRLLTVLFLLVTLGFLALISTVDFGIDGTYERVMVKLGLVLLTIGATYGLMMFVVSQIRARRKQEQISDEISAQLAHQHAAPEPQQMPAQQMPAQQMPAPQMPAQQMPAQQMPQQPGQVPTGMAPAQVPEEPPAGGYAPVQQQGAYAQQPVAQQPVPQQTPAPPVQQPPTPRR